MEYYNGKTQYQSYMEAYPISKNWTRASVDVRASNLMNNSKIKVRLEELGWKDKTEVLWTRKKALETITKMLKRNEEDMERKEKVFEQMKEQKFNELSKWIELKGMPNIDEKKVQQQIDKTIADIQNIELRRRADSVNNNGIIRAVQTMNRMMGLDITKVEITNVDNEREEMEKLSAEELRELININNKKENN